MKERKRQTARQRDCFYNLPGCGWVQFKGQRKKGAREVVAAEPDKATRKAFWSRYQGRHAPQMKYRRPEGTILMPGVRPESWKMD